MNWCQIWLDHPACAHVKSHPHDARTRPESCWTTKFVLLLCSLWCLRPWDLHLAESIVVHQRVKRWHLQVKLAASWCQQQQGCDIFVDSLLYHQSLYWVVIENIRARGSSDKMPELCLFGAFVGSEWTSESSIDPFCFVNAFDCTHFLGAFHCFLPQFIFLGPVGSFDSICQRSKEVIMNA